MGEGAVRAFLGRHGLGARRRLGQNFLCDDALAARLAGLAGVEPGDAVIEVGTGLGILTRALAERARRVVTLEVDSGIVRALRAEGRLPDSVELLHADVLETDLARLVADCGPPVRLVANLPYSISAPVLRRLLDLRDVLVDWSVMVQLEVGERLRAGPGSRDYGSLAVLHGLLVEVGRALVLEPGCFHPRPKVRSAFLRISPRPQPPLGAAELAGFERFVRAAFATRRKTLANCLRAGLEPPPAPDRLAEALGALGIDPRARAESLEPERLLALWRALG